MTNSQKRHPKPPTTKQLDYLEQLALRCGQSFAYPRTSKEASAEIDRLKKAKRTSPQDRRRETRAVQRDMAERRVASVRPEEVVGYGGGATWNRHVEDEQEELERERRFLAAR